MPFSAPTGIADASRTAMPAAATPRRMFVRPIRAMRCLPWLPAESQYGRILTRRMPCVDRLVAVSLGVQKHLLAHGRMGCQHKVATRRRDDHLIAVPDHHDPRLLERPTRLVLHESTHASRRVVLQPNGDGGIVVRTKVNFFPP